MLLTLILFILLLAVFGKWIAFILIMPFQSTYANYKKGHHNLANKVLATPFWLIDKVTRGGYFLWAMYIIGLCPSNRIRKLYCKIAGAKISKNVVMHIGLQIRSPWQLQIDKGTIIGDHAILDARGGLSIGSNVNLSSNVSIWTLQHDYRKSDFACPSPQERRLDVKIEDRAWLGCNVIVLPGVTIGEGAVCCGGCVVTKDVEPYTVVAGIPAKAIGLRPRNLSYVFNGKTCMFY